jgi:hypothetical protein
MLSHCFLGFKETDMKLLRSCLRVLALFALIAPLAGCDSGGPEAFAPGSTPAVTPAATGTAEPVASGAKRSSSPKRYQRDSYEAQGPQAHP